MCGYHAVLVLLCVFECLAAPFSWQSCGSDSLIKIASLDVIQTASQTVSVTTRSKVGLNLTSPIQGELTLHKKTFLGWIKVPCLDGFGSCHYDDICKLSPYTPTQCPQPFKDNSLPCTCPILQGTYAAKKFPINLNILPKWLEKGRYQSEAVITANNTQLLCLKLDITIT